jgi:hypothetical protein
MCHHVHVTLTAEDKQTVKRMSGLMIPVYASIMLAAIVVVAAGSGTRQNELVAARSAPVATR